MKTIDEYILKFVEWFVTSCVEWFDVSHKHVEYALIYAYAFFAISSDILDMVYGRFSRGKGLLLIALVSVICQSLIDCSKVPDAVRAAVLHHPIRIIMRYVVLIFIVVNVSLDLIVLTKMWMLCNSFDLPCYFIALIATAIPHKGDRGKKKKEALAKLKATLSIGWSTAPQGA